MTTFDLLLVAVILMGGIWGMMAGASRITIPFVLTIVGVTIFYTYPQLAALFKTEPVAKLFLYLLVLFVSLIIFGLLLRIIRNAINTAGLGPLDKVAGLALGLIAGAVIIGAAIWGIETYAGDDLRSLLKGSQLSPSAITFFKHIMAFTDRFFPQPEKPWWKRPLW